MAGNLETYPVTFTVARWQDIANRLHAMTLYEDRTGPGLIARTLEVILDEVEREGRETRADLTIYLTPAEWDEVEAVRE